jgi:hydroxymethylbilane synthase
MLPAPAQGAIMVVCRQGDDDAFQCCQAFNDEQTSICARIERDFLKMLLGGCSTPISALATIADDQIHFSGNILSTDGKQKVEVERKVHISAAASLGKDAALELFSKGGQKIADTIRNASK